jgi:integral membrane protein
MNQEDRLKTLLKFRVISISEGISLVVLLFMAMPLKWIFGMPEMVKYVGWIHGILFITYVLVLFPTSRSLQWTFRTTFLGLMASMLPFGPFIFDRKLKNEEKLIKGEK